MKNTTAADETPTRTELIDAIRRILVPEIEAAGLRDEDIADDQDLIGTGVLDSYSLIELIVAIEHTYELNADLNSPRMTGGQDTDFIPSIDKLVSAFLSDA